MKNEFDLGPTPSGESCEQLGPNYNPRRAMKECQAFINQLVREFGTPPIHSHFKITSNPHDFGTYHEVAVVYDDDYPETANFAYRVEGQVPESWDELAREELGLDRFGPPASAGTGKAIPIKSSVVHDHQPLIATPNMLVRGCR